MSEHDFSSTDAAYHLEDEEIERNVVIQRLAAATSALPEETTWNRTISRGFRGRAADSVGAQCLGYKGYFGCVAGRLGRAGVVDAEQEPLTRNRSCSVSDRLCCPLSSV
jgi:hypothetical protein